MATTKKPTSESKDKEHAGHAPKKAAHKPASGLTMDIIPKNKVRPTTTSRPVITNSGPGVADNTLTQPSGAPLLHGRNRLKIAPLDDTTDDRPDTDSRPTTDNQPKTAPAISKDEGVSLEELIAKRQQKDDELKEAPAELPTPEPVVIAAPEPLTRLEPSRPAPTELAQEVAADREAAAQAASLLADEPIGQVQQNPSTPEKAPEPPTSTAVADILREEEPIQPQEHSQALKDELKDMDANGGPKEHHELYGGKPVIIVHKDHGMSAVAWVLWFVFCVALALVAVNFLLDADVITTDYRIPHTNIL